MADPTPSPDAKQSDAKPSDSKGSKALQVAAAPSLTIEQDAQGNFRLEGPDVGPVDRGLAFQCVSDAAAAAKKLGYTFDPKLAPRKTGTDAVLSARRNPPKPAVEEGVVEA